MEEWKQIEGALEGYKISSLGNAVTPKGNKLTPFKAYKGKSIMYKYQTDIYGWTSVCVGNIIKKHFPGVILEDIEGGKYINKRYLSNKNRGLEICELVKIILSNTDKRNKKINSLIIDFLEKGDSHFTPLYNEGYEVLSFYANYIFNNMKKSYNRNINMKKSDISETADDFLQEFHIKVGTFLRDGRFDGKTYIKWSKAIINNDIKLFFLNRDKKLQGWTPKQKRGLKHNLAKQDEFSKKRYIHKRKKLSINELLQMEIKLKNKLLLVQQEISAFVL